MKHWKTEKQKILIKDQWITVRADTCRTAQDVEVDPYYVLEYKDWVQVVVFDDRMRILITKLYRHGNGEICLEIPAGTMDEKDESPEAAARRELLEETGYTSDRFISLGSVTPNSATHNNMIHYYAAYNGKKIQEPHQDPSEDIEFEFVEIPQVLEWIRRGTFYQAMHISCLFLALWHAGQLGLLPWTDY